MPTLDDLQREATQQLAILLDQPPDPIVEAYLQAITDFQALLETAFSAHQPANPRLNPARQAAREAATALQANDLERRHRQAIDAIVAYQEALDQAVAQITPSQQTLYVYRCRSRPPGYGSVPDGRLADYDRPGYTWNNCGTVVYPRPLTPAEIYRFELLPLSPEPVLPLYPPDTRVRDLRNISRVYTVEFLDNQYWIGDDIMERLTDWLFYEPVPDQPTQTPEGLNLNCNETAPLKHPESRPDDPGNPYTSMRILWPTTRNSENQNDNTREQLTTAATDREALEPVKRASNLRPFQRALLRWIEQGPTNKS